MEEMESELTEPILEENPSEDFFSDETDPGDTFVEDTGFEDSIPENISTDLNNGETSENDPGISEELTEPERTEESGNEEPAESSFMTVSGNDVVTVSGNAVILPNDFDLSVLGSNNESSPVDIDALVQVVENQTQAIYAVSFAVLLLLGVIAGILLVHGFRLRRT